MGASVDETPAYETVKPDHDTLQVKEMLEKREIDVVTFTSSSTVNNFVEMFAKEREELQKWMTHVAVACIGPVTARTAEEKGLSVSLTPKEYTIEALTNAIVQYFETSPSSKA